MTLPRVIDSILTFLGILIAEGRRECAGDLTR
jgi:hypothetical protein